MHVEQFYTPRARVQHASRHPITILMLDISSKAPAPKVGYILGSIYYLDWGKLSIRGPNLSTAAQYVYIYSQRKPNAIELLAFAVLGARVSHLWLAVTATTCCMTYSLTAFTVTLKSLRWRITLPSPVRCWATHHAE